MRFRALLRRSFVPCVALAAVLAGSPGVHALDLNGWLPARGHGDLAFSSTFESYEEFWMGDQKVSDPGVGRVETGSVAFWMQWGFTDWCALVANLAFVDAGSDGTGGFEEIGLQDQTFLAKVQVASLATGQARHRVVAAAGVRTPAAGYQANQPVDIGDGTTDALFRVVYQLEWQALYLSQQLGYDVRNQEAPDGFPLYTELGWTRGPVTLTGQYSVYVADGGTDIGDPGFTFPSNGDEYQRLGAKVYGRLSDRFGISISAFTTLDGRNAGDANGFSTGINVRM